MTTRTATAPSEGKSVQNATSWARLIAFYLPQFHPIPENDEWWGPGFTEWTNVAKARPRFPGHYQPVLPGDLGFYDLRLPETRAAQAALARQYGIEGFCYYHYWFAGRRLIERPFNEVLASGQPDLPFCLCWANQSWTGIWHGAPRRILIEQTYPGEADHRAHFAAVLPALRDPRAIKVDGKPLFSVYMPDGIPNVRAFTDLWRELALKAGLPGIHFSGVSHDPAWTPAPSGFDSRIPHQLPPVRAWFPWKQPISKVFTFTRQRLGIPTVYRYEDAIKRMLLPALPNTLSFPCVVPNWDNTARSGPRGRVLRDSTPELFGRHLRDAFETVKDEPRERRIIFIKSWNEWAEGNHLEPDRKFGHGYLEAVRNALTEMAGR